jgi:hypothetical protein
MLCLRRRPANGIDAQVRDTDAVISFLLGHDTIVLQTYDALACQAARQICACSPSDASQVSLRPAPTF